MKRNIVGGITRSAHLSSSLHYDSLADFRSAGGGKPVLPGQTADGFDNGYGLQGNPTNHELQDVVSALEGGKYTLLYPSGLTALTALGGLLKSGDHWLVPSGTYAPFQRYASYLQDRFGVTYSIYDPLKPSSVSRQLTPRTKLIHIESPSSVTFETTPIKEIIALAKQRGILTSADNTWAAGVLCQPLRMGVDISVLSLTKYAAGYSDVFMGSVTTSSESLFKALAYHHRVHGFTVSPVSAMLVARGFESLPVRLAAHDANATKLIDVVQKHSATKKVYRADSRTSSDLTSSNGLFSIELRRQYADAELEAILAGLNVFAIGESWGGTKSLVLPFQSDDLGERIALPEGTILRFHAGLEDVERQIADMHAILARL